LLAANNIKKFAFVKKNTVGTTEIKACGDNGYCLSVNKKLRTL
jgi:hypothetical protein